MRPGDAVTSRDLVLVPGAGEAVRRLQEAGYLVIMVTNQPGIAKGFIDWDDVHTVHAEIDDQLARSGAFLTDKYVCPHHPQAGFAGERAELKIACDCRKPRPGLLLRARDDYNIDLARSFMVGDRTVDAAAAIAAGCAPLMVRTGFGRAGRHMRDRRCTPVRRSAGCRPAYLCAEMRGRRP